MKKILFVNGSENFEIAGVNKAQGELNKHIITKASEMLKNIDADFEFKYSNVIDVNIDFSKEVEKVMWADIVYYQTPVYWMDIPGKFKVWLDHTFSTSEGIMYANDGRSSQNPTKNYGTGGLCKNKQYFFSTTWNAPKEAFTDKNEFFEGRNVDEVFMHFQKANQFLGITKLGSFHFHDVFKNPQFEKDFVDLEALLRKLFV